MKKRQTALITGASSGIGLDLARLFARDQYDLFLVARSEERLREIAAELEREHKITATVIAADLTRPEAPDTIIAATHDAEIDVLVNNAGIGFQGRFDQLDTRRQLDVIQVNLVALTHLTRLVLPRMLTRHSGRILNIGSTAGFQPGPRMAVYYATKAYVLSFSEAIAEELAATGVTVTLLCPGPTSTGFAETADMTKSRLFTVMRPMKSTTVARKGYEAMQRGQRLVIPGWLNKITAQATRITPRKMVVKIAKIING